MNQNELSNSMAYKVSTRVLFFLISAFVLYKLLIGFYAKFEPQDFSFGNLSYWDSVGVKFQLFFVYAFLYLFLQSIFALFKSGYMSASLFVGFAAACMINLISCFFFGVMFGIAIATILFLAEILAYMWYFKTAETVLAD